MKRLKPIALKKASILSNEEMKNLFGGSAIDPGILVSMVCNIGAQCVFLIKKNAYIGHCVGSAVDNTVACFCESRSGLDIIRAVEEICFKQD